jgi:cyclopropane-fatty-acyl-phospholipid synthase
MPLEPILQSTSSVRENSTSLSKSSSVWKSLLLKHCRDLAGGQLIISDSEGQIRCGNPGGLQAKIQIHDSSVYRRLVFGGTMALAETYMEGLWDSPNLFHLFRCFAQQRELIEKIDGPLTRFITPLLKGGEWLRANTLSGSQKNIAAHYDLGNDLFKIFLDPSLTYSSALFERPDMSLEEASMAKIDRMCRLIEAKPTDHIIEIGSGWGSFALHAATKYGCRLTTITLSEEQKKCVEARISQLGLEQQVTVLLKDYRKLEGQFDKLVSIEMIEAVGHKYLGDYFRQCSNLLKTGGIAAIQAITLPDQAYAAHLKNVDFIQKYIFPGSKIPCVSVLLEQARNNSQLVLSDLKDLTLDYAKTMQLWRANFMEKIEDVKALGYDERFIRMWDYYLNYCAAGFADRYLGTVQMQFRKL